MVVVRNESKHRQWQSKNLQTVKVPAEEITSTELSPHLPRWYKIELIAAKKNSETISTLPFRVIISVLVSVVVAIFRFFSYVIFFGQKHLEVSHFCITPKPLPHRTTRVIELLGTNLQSVSLSLVYCQLRTVSIGIISYVRCVDSPTGVRSTVLSTK